MPANETTPPREAVRPAVAMDVPLGTPRKPAGAGHVLAVDDDTGGGLVARVRAAVAESLRAWVTTGYAPSEGDLEWAANAMAADVIEALGVQP